MILYRVVLLAQGSISLLMITFVAKIANLPITTPMGVIQSTETFRYYIFWFLVASLATFL